MWASKPHLSYTGCGKGRAGGVAGGKMGGKKVEVVKGVMLEPLVLLLFLYRYLKFRAIFTHYIFQRFCII